VNIAATTQVTKNTPQQALMIFFATKSMEDEKARANKQTRPTVSENPGRQLARMTDRSVRSAHEQGS
jgi:guanylate kinase